MKNITGFDKFKKYKRLNEEADSGSWGGGGDSSMANVKGNLSNIEDTLLGASVFKILRFFKRKVNEGVLYIYKKALFREYLANVLRYAIKNNLVGEDPNVLYKVKKIGDENGETIDGESEEELVKFTSTKQVLSVYLVGSKVVYEKKKPWDVPDGKYLKLDDESTFVVKNTIITEINQKEIDTGDNPGDNPGDKSGDKSDAVEPKKLVEIEGLDLKLVGDDIIKLAQEIENDIKFVSPENFSELEAKKSEITLIIDTLISWINGIGKDLKKYTDNTRQIKLKSLLEIYKNEKLVLDTLISWIDWVANDIKKSVQLEKTKSIDPTVDPTEQVEAKNDSYKWNPLNEAHMKISKGTALRGIKLGGVDRKLADEVGDLDMSILDNEDFAKQFEPEDRKKAVTSLVKENYAAIVKIQIAAERIYKPGGKNTIDDQKLLNTWEKMVNDVKNLFSRYMITAEVDPFVLRKTLPITPQIQGDSSSLTKSTDNMVNSNESIRNKLLTLKNDFNNDKSTTGILVTNDNRYLFIHDEINIPGAGKFPVLKIIGIIKKGFEKIDDISKLNDFISMKQEDLFNTFKGVKSHEGSEYVATYIIGYNVGKIKIPSDSSDSITTSVNILNLYVSGTDRLKPTKINTDYKIYTLDKNFKEKPLSVPSISTVDKVLRENYTYTIKVSGALHLTDMSNETNYGVTPNMKMPSLSKLFTTDVDFAKIFTSLRVKK